MNMCKHFENIKYLYGDAYVQIPNGVFRDLSENIKNKNKTNIQQSSFAYVYLVVIAFLYKYANFVDLNNYTYIQNSDIKQILGYGKTTKTIDRIIKKNGVLDSIGLTKTTKDYPIRIEYTNNLFETDSMRELTTISMLSTDDMYYNTIKEIVKNKNYEIKEPFFFFEYDGDTGTLVNYSNTHRITIDELISFILNQELNNIDFMLYCFLKSKCYGLPHNTKAISLCKISSELGIGRDTFYTHLETLKRNSFIEVKHKPWVSPNKKGSMESNEYTFKGVY